MYYVAAPGEARLAGCGPGHFTHAAAPNQLLGGGTQRLRRMLEVRAWHGVARGTGRAGVVEGQGGGLGKGAGERVGWE